MRLSARHLLGLPPSDAALFRCPFCDLPSGDLQLNPWHPISCQRIAGTSATRRHNTVADKISQFATRLGGYVSRPTKRDGLRHDNQVVVPDLDVQFGPSRYIIDVTIRDPSASSHQRQASKASLAVAASAESEKKAIYEQHVERMRPKPTIVPFVVESYGGFGIEASKFVSDLVAQSASLSSVWQPKEFVNSLFWSIACAVQRWNASIMRQAMRMR
jgi:hypothetical protein